MSPSLSDVGVEAANSVAWSIQFFFSLVLPPGRVCPSLRHCFLQGWGSKKLPAASTGGRFVILVPAQSDKITLPRSCPTKHLERPADTNVSPSRKACPSPGPVAASNRFLASNR